MSNTFKAGTLLIDKRTNLAYLVQESFVVTKVYEHRRLLAVGAMTLKSVRLDLSTLSDDFDVIVPDET